MPPGKSGPIRAGARRAGRSPEYPPGITAWPQAVAHEQHSRTCFSAHPISAAAAAQGLDARPRGARATMARTPIEGPIAMHAPLPSSPRRTERHRLLLSARLPCPRKQARSEGCFGTRSSRTRTRRSADRGRRADRRLRPYPPARDPSPPVPGGQRTDAGPLPRTARAGRRAFVRSSGHHERPLARGGQGRSFRRLRFARQLHPGGDHGVALPAAGLVARNRTARTGIVMSSPAAADRGARKPPVRVQGWNALGRRVRGWRNHPGHGGVGGAGTRLGPALHRRVGGRPGSA